MVQQREVRVGLRRGVHARVAARLSARAGDFHSSLYLRTDRFVSLASSMEVLGLGICCGDRVAVVASGADEREALAAISALLESPED